MWWAIVLLQSARLCNGTHLPESIDVEQHAINRSELANISALKETNISNVETGHITTLSAKVPNMSSIFHLISIRNYELYTTTTVYPWSLNGCQPPAWEPYYIWFCFIVNDAGYYVANPITILGTSLNRKSQDHSLSTLQAFVKEDLRKPWG